MPTLGTGFGTGPAEVRKTLRAAIEEPTELRVLAEKTRGTERRFHFPLTSRDPVVPFVCFVIFMSGRRGETCTTGEVARRCGVTKRTVVKWIESGRLRGYTIPGSRHRRVAAADLAAFMKAHGIPDAEGAIPRRRILIVDDDPDIAELLRDALRERYEIEVAATALEAAARVPVFRPDALLVDVRLPDVNGLELCRQLRAMMPDGAAPVLAMSAYGSEVDPSEVRRSGAVAFLPKPLPLAELKKRIRSMVG